MLWCVEGKPPHTLLIDGLLSVLDDQALVAGVYPLTCHVVDRAVSRLLLAVGYLLDAGRSFNLLYSLGDVQLVDADITLDVCAIDGSDIIELVCELF